VVPAGSDRVSRARPYSGVCRGRPTVFAYRAFTVCGAGFHPLRLTIDFVTSRPAGRRIKTDPTTPARKRLPSITPHRFGLFPFRSPLLRESRFLSFPPVTKMFQFTGLPSPALFDSGRDTRALPRVGFPIRTSRGQRMVSSSPGLFAAAHVLHRLLAPRHPPCALSLLIMKNTVVAAMEFSRCARDAPAEKPGRRPVSQNSTATNVEVDVIPGGPGSPDEDCRSRTSPAAGVRLIDGPGSLRSARAPDSLERR
jgi:hypothetical protein